MYDKDIQGMKIAVVCGGVGAEREVSLASGDVIHGALLRAGVPNTKAVVPADNAAKYLEALECDIAVLMLHGEWGEDGGAQAILERRGIFYTGPRPEAAALAMDKNASKQIFAANGIPTPRWTVCNHPDTAARAVDAAGLRYPLFVKPNFRGSSVGAGRVNAPNELEPAVRRALDADRLCLIEELVAGRELTVGWLDGRTLPVIELCADGVFYDYDAKYLSDKTRYICPADIGPVMTEHVSLLARMAVEALNGRDTARVDFMLGPCGPMALEVNSLPGCTTHSLVPMAAAQIGIDICGLACRLVEMACKRAGNRCAC